MEMELFAAPEVTGVVSNVKRQRIASDLDNDSGHWSADPEIDLPFTGEQLSDEDFKHELCDCVPPISKSKEAQEFTIRFTSEFEDDETSELEHDVDTERTEDSVGPCCIVCLEETTVHMEYNYEEMIPWFAVANYIELPCCSRRVCKECMQQIIATNVGEGRIQIFCPHPECGKPLPKRTILSHMQHDPKTKEKYNRFCLDVEGDGTKKTCPNCCQITEHHLPRLRKLTDKELKVRCPACELEWCFRCQAPWHKSLSCQVFQKGNTQFKTWTRERNGNGIANCQKCPTCRVFIQRSTGCPHMTCSRCDTHFCYDCGGRFLDVLFIDHKYGSELEFWGCPKDYLPNNPVKRKLARGGWLGARISFLAGYPVLLVGAAALVIVGGLIILPVYGGYKLYRYHKNMRKYRRRMRKD